MRCCGSIGWRPIKLLLLMLFVGFMLWAFRQTRNFEAPVRTNLSNTKSISVVPSNADAEFTSSSQIQLDSDSTAAARVSQPLLPEDRPDWVAMPDQVDVDVHEISIGTELASSKDECQSKLDEALLNGVRRYIDEHLTQGGFLASTLTELNVSWIREKLLDSDSEYDAILSRPAGTYHQLWVRLKIDEEARATIGEWIRRSETKWRASVVGMVGAGMVVCLSLLNAGLKFFVQKP